MVTPSVYRADRSKRKDILWRWSLKTFFPFWPAWCSIDFFGNYHSYGNVNAPQRGVSLCFQAWLLVKDEGTAPPKFSHIWDLRLLKEVGRMTFTVVASTLWESYFRRQPSSASKRNHTCCIVRCVCYGAALEALWCLTCDGRRACSNLLKQFHGCELAKEWTSCHCVQWMKRQMVQEKSAHNFRESTKQTANYLSEGNYMAAARLRQSEVSAAL